MIKLDDLATWPERLLAEIESQQRLPQLPEAGQVEYRIDRLLSDEQIVAYHCTRLTAGEADSVRSSGLRPLTTDLVLERVSAAVEESELDGELARTILQRHWTEDPTRSGSVALFGVLDPFRSPHRRHTYHYLLGEWGGEAVAYPLEGTDHQASLRRIGTATVVVVAVDVNDIARASPSLLLTLWTAFHRPDEELHSEIVVRSHVPADCILDLVQPGSSQWVNLFGEDWVPFR